PCRWQILRPMSSPIVSFKLANTFISINSANNKCGLMPSRCAMSRTTNGGFIWMTLLPCASSVNSGPALATATGRGGSRGRRGGLGGGHQDRRGGGRRRGRIAVFRLDGFGGDLVHRARVALDGITDGMQLVQHVLVGQATMLGQFVYANAHDGNCSPGIS